MADLIEKYQRCILEMVNDSFPERFKLSRSLFQERVNDLYTVWATSERTAAVKNLGEKN